MGDSKGDDEPENISKRGLKFGRYLLTGSSPIQCVSRSMVDYIRGGTYQEIIPFSAKMCPSRTVKSFETEAIRYIESLVVAGDVSDSFPRMTP